MKPKVYLAGPMAGLLKEVAQNWRIYAKEKLAPDILAFSPLRKYDHLAENQLLDGNYKSNPLTTSRGVNTRDHFDCFTSDVILCNLVGTTSISIGTVMEIAWAFAYRKPLVVIQPLHNLYNHPMIDEAISFKVNSLDEGIDVVRAILLND